MNPEFAVACLQDAFWERRAIAVRYAPLEAIRASAGDEDKDVREQAWVRLNDTRTKDTP